MYCWMKGPPCRKTCQRTMLGESCLASTRKDVSALLMAVRIMILWGVSDGDDDDDLQRMMMIFFSL